MTHLLWVLTGYLNNTLKTGKYEVRCDDPSYGCNVTNITVSSVDLKLKLQKGTKTVSKVAQGTPIRIKFTGLDPKEHDGVTLKVTDPSGNLRTWNIPDGKVFEKVNVSYCICSHQKRKCDRTVKNSSTRMENGLNYFLLFIIYSNDFKTEIFL